MSQYIINGGTPLNGEVFIRGAKNASYKQIIASMLTDEPVELINIPQISDVRITASIASHLGAKINEIGEHGITIQTQNITSSEIPSGTGEKSRTSFIFTGPLLARVGQITFPSPGGDKLGKRPLDRLFACLKQMNVEIVPNENSYILKTTGLIGTDYTFPKPSHTVTEVVLMTAVMANGETIIRNAAIEPEIDDLIELLNLMGSKIKRDKKNPSIIYISGVTKLHGTTHQIISDRNEAVTFACAALSTRGSVSILRINPHTISTFLKIIEKMGAKINWGKDEVLISWVKPLMATSIETEPEPGFMTDWQAVFSLVLTQAVGVSSVIERVYPNRFQHIKLLNQMGAKTKFFQPEINNTLNYYHFNPESDKPEYFHGVKIYGPAKLLPTKLVVSDLRAGATSTLAALTAQGKSTIEGVEFIERGYEKLAERLKSLGADIKYIKTK
ncbi:UDP-N-acetylglucosamine 1-carboxyvinyltransferase [Candidatus Shapirobacteria bacterium CG2_30_35_20]|uniref:UDP-N-acetylglucosamine 1-carboxyvinyltransferase n=2 Tax=Candidatus Shapironibacteriota TaxID=1752721 RepID=A0A1J5I5I6_9BACT|nr:MAG: UDP-N-acetylglucosamine 1-carboxyvinyltransferase [Candidatus Shapirobacteria bacterium CG2_30_35_20]